ncbi:hypothetical protein [Microbacterium trichothecenolyticum]|uniref:Uncharacterized protein n=1 Tax=Microbacterium trichothecenolyticum TaxID=69370 RepID=A0ABU0TR75_MICTR|nr:hypothetical protein [Microbacterium trichothecenolyticum]MDQ1122161.1 hypothetical protein [Microbacterium trichothecenolyticum]
MPNHGDYSPAKGWYDSTTKAWHATPDKLTRVDPGKPIDDATRAQFDGWAGDEAVKRDPEMDRLIALRDSDRPDERQRFEKAVDSGLRMRLGMYEQQLAEAQHETP